MIPVAFFMWHILFIFFMLRLWIFQKRCKNINGKLIHQIICWLCGSNSVLVSPQPLFWLVHQSSTAFLANNTHTFGNYSLLRYTIGKTIVLCGMRYLYFTVFIFHHYILQFIDSLSNFCFQSGCVFFSAVGI